MIKKSLPIVNGDISVIGGVPVVFMELLDSDGALISQGHYKKIEATHMTRFEKLKRAQNRELVFEEFEEPYVLQEDYYSWLKAVPEARSYLNRKFGEYYRKHLIK